MSFFKTPAKKERDTPVSARGRDRFPSEVDVPPPPPPPKVRWAGGDDGDSEEEEEDSDSDVDEIWEDAQSKPPESPGLLTVSTHIKF